MKDIGTLEIFVALLIVWGVVELVRGWWQVLIALAAVGGLVYVITRTNRKPAELDCSKYDTYRNLPAGVGAYLRQHVAEFDRSDRARRDAKRIFQARSRRRAP